MSPHSAFPEDVPDESVSSMEDAQAPVPEQRSPHDTLSAGEWPDWDSPTEIRAAVLRGASTANDQAILPDAVLDADAEDRLDSPQEAVSLATLRRSESGGAGLSAAIPSAEQIQTEDKERLAMTMDNDTFFTTPPTESPLAAERMASASRDDMYRFDPTSYSPDETPPGPQVGRLIAIAASVGVASAAVGATAWLIWNRAQAQDESAWRSFLSTLKDNAPTTSTLPDTFNRSMDAVNRGMGAVRQTTQDASHAVVLARLQAGHKLSNVVVGARWFRRGMLLGTITGALGGVIGGLLLAPKPGKQTRTQVRAYVEKVRPQVSRAVDKARPTVSRVVDKGVTQLNNLASSVTKTNGASPFTTTETNRN